MWSKNHHRLTVADKEHLAEVKSLPCSLMDDDDPPHNDSGYAHHIRQGDHYTAVALCRECHQGGNGWHGNKSLWRIKKMDELDALNVTIRRLRETKG